MTTYKMPTAVKVKYSPGKGRGVFATRLIKRGEVIEKAPAVTVPASEGDDLLASFLEHYLFQTDNGRHYVIGLGYTSLINHSDDPNTEFHVAGDNIKMTAIRAIPAGREVTVDYGWTEREWASVGRKRK